MTSNTFNAGSSGDSIHEVPYRSPSSSPAASFTASFASSYHPLARRDREVHLSSSSVHIPIPEPVHHRREPSINLESLQDSSSPEGPPPYSPLPLPHEKLPKYRATPSAWETSRDGGGGGGRVAVSGGKEWQKSWRVTIPIAVFLTLVVVVAVVLGMQSRRDAAAIAAAEDDANGGPTFTLLPLPFLATGIFHFVVAASSSDGNCTTNNSLWSCATYGPAPFTWELSRSDPGYPGGVLETPYVLTPRSPPFFAPSRLHYARDGDGLGRYFASVPHDKVTYAYNVTSRLTRGSGVSQAAAIPADATARDLRAALPGYTGSEDVTRCVWAHTSLSIDLYIDPEPLPFSPASGLAAATDIPVWPGRVAVHERRAADPRTLDPDNPARATFCGKVNMRNGVVAVDAATFVREFPDSPGWGGEGGLGVLKGDYKACECSWGADDEAEADMR